MIYKQINIYKQNKLSKHRIGFRKSYRTQHFLIIILEKWKSAWDNGGNVCVLFIGCLKDLWNNKSSFITTEIKRVWVFNKRIRPDV